MIPATWASEKFIQGKHGNARKLIINCILSGALPRLLWVNSPMNAVPECRAALSKNDQARVSWRVVASELR